MSFVSTVLRRQLRGIHSICTTRSIARHRRSQAHSGKLSASEAISVRRPSSAGTVATSRPAPPRRDGAGLRSASSPSSSSSSAEPPLPSSVPALPVRPAPARGPEPGRDGGFPDARPMPAPMLLGLYTVGFFVGLRGARPCHHAVLCERRAIA